MTTGRINQVAIFESPNNSHNARQNVHYPC